MRKDVNLQFIRNKIYELRSAIMYSMSNELVKIPNNIVNAVLVNDKGELWFLSKKPQQFISECEQIFPVRLKFYRKGISFYIEISGMATIVNEAFEKKLLPETDQTTNERPVLIKMNMKNIEYVEMTEKKKSRAEIAIENGYNWLLKTVAFHRHSKSVLRALRQPSI
ncbi:MAG: hypothetical protein ABUT20_10215 [Bacteroidota bacterium]